MTNPYILNYISDLNVQFHTARATEYSYRPALKELLQTFLPGMVVSNEPSRFECGAPDYIIPRQHSQENNRVYINPDQYFDCVPESAWIFYVGGCQSAQKCPKDRISLTLTLNDVKHYSRIIYVLHKTKLVMIEVEWGYYGFFSSVSVS